MVFAITEGLIGTPVREEAMEHLMKPKFTLPMLTKLLLTLQSAVPGFDIRADCKYARQVVAQSALVLNIKEFRITPRGTDTGRGVVLNGCEAVGLRTLGFRLGAFTLLSCVLSAFGGVREGIRTAKLPLDDDLGGRITGYAR